MYVDYRPKKSPPSGPALPTRQSLRLRNKDPDGVPLPDPPPEMYQSVDEHVSTGQSMAKKALIRLSFDRKAATLIL